MLFLSLGFVFRSFNILVGFTFSVLLKPFILLFMNSVVK